MFKINTTIQGLDKLQKEIDRVDKLLQLQTNIQLFNTKLAERMLKIVNEVANNRISMFPTTNEEHKSEYLRNNKYQIEGNTIIIYNDTKITSPKSRVSDAYEFSIAMAFEYGTGIIGEQNPKIGAWKYDVNKENNRAFVDGEKIDGWWIPKSKAGGVNTLAESRSGNAVVVQGYEGMEIYRFAREEIIKQLPKLINDLLNETEV